MPRFNAAPATVPSFGSGFDNVAMRDTLADFRDWWDRNCLLAGPAGPMQETPLQKAA